MIKPKDCKCYTKPCCCRGLPRKVVKCWCTRKDQLWKGQLLIAPETWKYHLAMEKEIVTQKKVIEGLVKESKSFLTAMHVEFMGTGVPKGIFRKFEKALKEAMRHE